MPTAPPDRDRPAQLNPHSRPRPEQPPPGRLSQSDPEPERSTRRAPLWLILIVVLVVGGMIALHLTGVVGPGTH